MTWSVEKLIDEVSRYTRAQAALVLAPVLDVLYPPLTHDYDKPVDGSEQLAEREAETDALDPYFAGAAASLADGSPTPSGLGARKPSVREDKQQGTVDPQSNLFDTPPAERRVVDVLKYLDGEPPLSADELVAIRGVLQERYGYPTDCDGHTLVDWLHEKPWCVEHERLSAFCPPRCTTESAAASSAAAASPAEVDPPPGPSAGPLLDVDYLTPAICEVLTEHSRRIDINHPYYGNCRCGFKCADSQDHREHVAPLIAEHIIKALAAEQKN